MKTTLIGTLCALWFVGVGGAMLMSNHQVDRFSGISEKELLLRLGSCATCEVFEASYCWKKSKLCPDRSSTVAGFCSPYVWNAGCVYEPGKVGSTNSGSDPSPRQTNCDNNFNQGSCETTPSAVINGTQYYICEHGTGTSVTCGQKKVEGNPC